MNKATGALILTLGTLCISGCPKDEKQKLEEKRQKEILNTKAHLIEFRYNKVINNIISKCGEKCGHDEIITLFNLANFECKRGDTKYIEGIRGTSVLVNQINSKLNEIYLDNNKKIGVKGKIIKCEKLKYDKYYWNNHKLEYDVPKWSDNNLPLVVKCDDTDSRVETESDNPFCGIDEQGNLKYSTSYNISQYNNF